MEPIQSLQIGTGTHPPTSNHHPVMPAIIYQMNIREDGSIDFHNRKEVWRSQHGQMGDHRLNWVLARFSYLHPRYHYELSFASQSIETNPERTRSAHQGRITRIDNKIKRLTQSFQPTLLVSSFEETKEYRDLMKRRERHMRLLAE